MAKRRRIIHVFWFLLVILLTREQSLGQQVFITVIDRQTGQPVPSAHVCLEGLKNGRLWYTTTSPDGKAVNDCREPSKLTITFMGYNPYHDTINPGTSLTVWLNPAVFNMNEVVVTAQFTPERADKSIYQVDVINSREMEIKAATNMSDLLKDEISMNVKQDGVLGTSLNVQGLSGENVKFLIDGVPLIGRMNGNFDLNQINLNNADHVEIIEGPLSVIYGSNALAGVVNIITKENKSASLSSTANAYLESVGIYNFDAAVALKKRRISAGISGGRYFFDGYSPPSDTGRSQLFKPRRQYFSDGYFTYSLENLKIKAGADYFNELLVDKGELQPRYYETAFDSYFTTIRYSVRIEASWNLLKSWFLDMILAYSAYSRVKETYLKDLTTLQEIRTQDPEQQDTTRIKSVMGRLTLAKKTSGCKFNYQAGMDLTWESAYGKRILDHEQAIGDYAAFLSIKWDPVKSLSFQPGIRIIYNTNYQAPLVYAISGRWNFVKGCSLRLSWSKGFRAPSLKELYLSFVDANHEIFGNPGLKAETSNNVNASLQFSRETRKITWGLELSGFYNAIQNIITLAQVPGVSNDLEYTYVNLDKYKTTGGQADVTVSLYPSLGLSAGIAETGIAMEMANGNNTNGFIFSTDLNGNLSYRFAKPELTLGLIYKYTGKQQQPYLNGDTLTLGTIDGYNTLDVTATKGIWQNRIRLSCGVKNIFNNQVIPSAGLGGGGHGSSQGEGVAVGYGRTWFIKFSWSFNQYKN